MDTVEFFKTANRLCKDQGCKKCPACKEGACMVMRMIRLDDNSGESIEETISKVEQWAKDHPVKTRQSEFLKQFPNAQLNKDWVLVIDPCKIDTNSKEDDKCEALKTGMYSCSDCRKKYWLTEVTDNGNVY